MNSVSFPAYFVRGIVPRFFPPPKPSGGESTVGECRDGRGPGRRQAYPRLPGALLADDLDPLSFDHVPDAPQCLSSFATEYLQAVRLRRRQGNQQTTAGLGRPDEHL